MRKPRKYDYLLVLQGRYGFGWEDLCAADQTRTGRRKILLNLRDYRANEAGTYRIVSRRVPVHGDRCRCDGADHSDLDGGTADGRDYT